MDEGVVMDVAEWVGRDGGVDASALGRVSSSPVTSLDGSEGI